MYAVLAELSRLNLTTLFEGLAEHGENVTANLELDLNSTLK
jgi:hypothetical protein